MRVTIGQINTINGDFEGNTASIIRGIEQAKRENSNLVVFPETCIQGYTSLDWFLDKDVQRLGLPTPPTPAAPKDRRRNARHHRDRRHGETVKSADRPTSLQLRRRHSRSKT